VRDGRVYVEDILESISKIEEYTKAISKEEFFRNTQVQDAVLRLLEIIGGGHEKPPRGAQERAQGESSELTYEQITHLLRLWLI